MCFWSEAVEQEALAEVSLVELVGAVATQILQKPLPLALEQLIPSRSELLVATPLVSDLLLTVVPTGLVLATLMALAQQEALERVLGELAATLLDPQVALVKMALTNLVVLPAADTELVVVVALAR